MLTRRFTLLLATLLLILLLAAPVAAQQATPRLACDFEVEQVNVGDEIVLTIYIWDASNLFAYQFDLTYEGDLVAVVDADPQRPGDNAVLRDFLKPDLVINNQDDPRSEAVLLGASAAYPSEPVSGSGPLAQVRFRAESPGEARFGFTNVTLADDQAAVFTAREESCELIVLPVGEPTVTRAAAQTGSTEVPDSVATAVAGVVGTQAAGTGTPATGEPQSTDAAATTDESEDSPTATPTTAPDEAEDAGSNNFWLSALVGFAVVAGLVAVVVLALWWRWRAGGG